MRVRQGRLEWWLLGRGLSSVDLEDQAHSRQDALVFYIGVVVFVMALVVVASLV
jgi:hypothetical protein